MGIRKVDSFNIRISIFIANLIALIAIDKHFAIATPVIDGVIGSWEYPNSVPVNSTHYLGGFYDRSSARSFGGGLVGCHYDWVLYWGCVCHFLYEAINPLGCPATCDQFPMSIHRLRLQENPSTAEGVIRCCGRFFDSYLFKSLAAAGECCFGIISVIRGSDIAFPASLHNLKAPSQKDHLSEDINIIRA